MQSYLKLLLVAWGVLLPFTPAVAAPMTAGTTIGFDVQGGADSSTTYSFPGVLLPANSTWNVTDSDMPAGSVVDSTGTVVDGVSTARFGTTWSSWGTIVTAGKTNSVTQDYLFDANAVISGGHDARLDIFGLADDLVYNLAIHAARLQDSTDINGADVTINGVTFTIPDVDGAGASALWPNGGFEIGRTSAFFTNVPTNGAGGISVFFDKLNGEPIILTGFEIQAVPEAADVAMWLVAGAATVCWFAQRRRRQRVGC